MTSGRRAGDKLVSTFHFSLFIRALDMVSAWVFVVWGRPKYLVGAIAGAASLRQVGTTHRIVLMHAAMELPAWAAQLRPLFDEVIETELLRFRVRPLRTKRQRELYGGEFSETANTKWQCLSLTKYQKVMFMDSDIIFRRNCDFLFSLPAPAATFSSPFSVTYSRGGFPDPYRGLQHGAAVPAAAIQAGLRGATVAAGSMVLLEPAVGAVKAHVAWMRAHAPYGHPGCFSAIDEQAITEWMQDRGCTWHHIAPIYQAIPWKDNWVPGVPILDPVRGAFALHFYHDRPFETGKGTGWPDTKIFWATWHRFAREHPALERHVRPLMGHYEPPAKR